MSGDPLWQEISGVTRSQFPGPMVINASGKRIIFFIVFGSLFAAVGVWLTKLDRGLDHTIVGWATAVFGGWLALHALTLLIPGRAGMILDREGFTVFNGFWRRKHRWADISDIEVLRVRSGECVVFNDRRSTSTYGQMNRVVSGRNGYVPAVLTIDPQDTKRLLESWRDRAMAEQAPER